MIHSKTPVRLEFLGGSTDIPNFYKKSQGNVLNATINKYINVYINQVPNNFYKLTLQNKTRTFKDLEDIKNPIVREALRLLKVKPGIDLKITSDVNSRGTGLGTSSAFSVGLLNSLLHLKGREYDSEKLAELACKLEIDILKFPIGKEDQYAASFGGINHFVFNKNGKVIVNNINLSPAFKNKFEKHLLVFFTGLTRTSYDLLSNQNKRLNQNFLKLKTMGDLTLPAVNMLHDQDIESFSKILELEWNVKKKLISGITNNTIEKYYKKILMAGSWGVRLSGAGGGGYLYTFSPTSKRKTVIRAVGKEKLFNLKFTIDKSCVESK
jgi:D-glycero-alpha-D-manno-heptose-7-phosphate kinase